MSGKIIKIISNKFTVLADKKYDCIARGKFRNQKITPIVGDIVDFDEKKLVILDIKPRKNELKRPPVANIDQTLIVVSVKEPDLDLYLLDKLLCIVEYNNIKPIICFTKTDLLSDRKEFEIIKDYYKKIGYMVFENKEKEIKEIFKDKVTILAGQSGAGKSTLLNILDSSLDLKTGVISKALGRGKHTTRHVELINMLDGWCADTPGFSSLSLDEMSINHIKDNMVEFHELSHLCAYRDCMHDKDDKCEIKNRVGSDILKSRYDNYIKFIRNDRI